MKSIKSASIISLSFLLIGSMCLIANAQEEQAEKKVVSTMSELSVADSAIAKEVVNLVPQGKGITFSEAVGKVYCFTQIVGSEEETTIKHVWYHNEAKVAEVPLTIKSKSWRTYSSKNIPAGLVGDWKVDVLDSDGMLLKTLPFKVVANEG